MERKFTLSCCSTVDLPYSYMESRDIPVLFYTYVVDGQTYDDDMGRDPAALPRFYGFLKAGKLPQTSQINVAGYMDFFERLLQKGGRCAAHRVHVRAVLLGEQRLSGGSRAEGQVPRAKADRHRLPVAPPAATACWWTTPPICGTRVRTSTPWPSGCWTTGTRCITSSFPAI